GSGSRDSRNGARAGTGAHDSSRAATSRWRWGWWKKRAASSRKKSSREEEGGKASQEESGQEKASKKGCEEESREEKEEALRARATLNRKAERKLRFFVWVRVLLFRCHAEHNKATRGRMALGSRSIPTVPTRFPSTDTIPSPDQPNADWLIGSMRFSGRVSSL